MDWLRQQRAQSSREISKVLTAFGSGFPSRAAGSLNLAKRANSFLRPAVTAAARLLLEIAEEQKRSLRSELFAHEQQRWRRASRRIAAAARTARDPRRLIRSPNARFPI
jgi:hypothetical protein